MSAIINLVILSIVINAQAVEINSEIKLRALKEELNTAHNDRDDERVLALSKLLCDEYGLKDSCFVTAEKCRDSKYKYPYDCDKVFRYKAIDIKSCTKTKKHSICMIQAWNLAKLGRKKEALSLYKEYMEMDDGYDLNNYATVINSLGQRDQAFDYFKKSCIKFNKYGCFNASIMHLEDNNTKNAHMFMSYALKLGYKHFRYIYTDDKTKLIRNNTKMMKLIKKYENMQSRLE